MVWDVSTETTPVARKDYVCQASHWVINAELGDDEYAEEDLAIVQAAKKESWIIKKGMKYIKVTGLWNGEWSTFRAREDLNFICNKYDLYFE